MMSIKHVEYMLYHVIHLTSMDYYKLQAKKKKKKNSRMHL